MSKRGKLETKLKIVLEDRQVPQVLTLILSLFATSKLRSFMPCDITCGI